MPVVSRFSLCVRLLPLLVVMVLLAACAIGPPEPDEPTLAERADEARAQGNPERAFDLYQQAIEDSDDADEREVYRLRMADLHLDENRPGPARDLLGASPTEGVSELVKDLQTVIRARLELERGEPGEAVDLIEQRVPGEPAAQPRLLDVYAQALRALGRGLDSAEARTEAEELLVRPEDIRRNREQLWEALQETPMQGLRDVMPPAPDTHGGWIELAYLVRTYRLDPEQLQDVVEQWADRYPDHPALERLAGEAITRYREEAQPAHRVAVLLPLSGPLAEAGRAVRDGMLAAHFTDDNGGTRPQIWFTDVGEDGEDPWSAYLDAVQSGAELVIGPLSRDAVEELARDRRLPVPVLALNALHPDIEPPPNLYRFGLLPEDEARAAALHAARNGLRHAVVLVPVGDWGRRVRDAFTDAFEENGGVVLEDDSYLSDERDFAGPLRRLLDLDASEERARRLSRTIGRSVESEPRRRQDVDLVFLGAFHQQARLIRPQLRFHHGIGLPIMATSHVYTGNPEDIDRDTDGLIFFDMPWMLGNNTDLGPTRSELARYWQDGLERQARLYAMGMDAYRLMPMLAVLRSNPTETLDGATGTLNVDRSGQVQRGLIPARFSGGRVQPVRPNERPTD